MRVTSAGVYDSLGKKVRSLWMNRTYDRGKYEDLWDGRDDSGEKLPAARYTIKLGSNNIDYTWEGLVGNTESSWSSPNSWSGTVPSFIRALSFLGGRAYSANGYNEGGFAAATFSEKEPNSTVLPFTKEIFNTFQHFMFSATDGDHIFFGFQTYRAKPQPLQGVIAMSPSGDYYKFSMVAPDSSLSLTFRNNAVSPTLRVKDVRAIDLSSYPLSAITGLAVQRNGPLLATSHGFYKPAGVSEVPSANEIRLWNKVTGKKIATIAIPNPQGLAFDLQNRLWVISGYGTNDKLYRITAVGSQNLIDTPLQGLSNPISISVSPKTGTIFVADGGPSQQVKEYDPSTGNMTSSLGRLGGYVSQKGCNSTVLNDVFWFDPGPNMERISVVGTNSPFVSWVSVADSGDLWIGDFSTSRILHFFRSGKTWRYVDRIMYLPWNYSSSVPLRDPSRLFGGPTGFLEFRIDYSVPLLPGDPETPSGNRSWQLVKNWLPCFLDNDKSADLGTNMEAFSFPNHGVIAAIYSQTAYDFRTLLKLNEDGTMAVKHLGHLSGYSSFSESGDIYSISHDSPSEPTVSVRKTGLSGFDSEGFPSWYSIAKTVATYQAHHKNGEPEPSTQRSTSWPSSNGIIPIFETEKNLEVVPGRTAFHLAGLPVKGTELEWMSMPEKNIKFTDGEGTFPAADLRGKAQVGVNSWAMDDNLFAFQNANGSSWSCQFYHFKDDGLFVGQFGFQTSQDFMPANSAWNYSAGIPIKGSGDQLAPGECTDISQVNSVRVGTEYYFYLGDESYHRGIHRWKVSNLQSYREISASGELGTHLILAPQGTKKTRNP